MKNLLPICLIVNALGSFAYSTHAEPLAHVDNDRVMLLLKSYAEIVSLYQDQIDQDSLRVLSAKTADIESEINERLSASQDTEVGLIRQHFALRFDR